MPLLAGSCLLGMKRRAHDRLLPGACPGQRTLHCLRTGRYDGSRKSWPYPGCA